MDVESPRTEVAPAHPLLHDFRPSVATPAIEGLADAILLALEQGYRGLSVYGFARFGKTEAVRYLVDHPFWLKGRPAALLFIEATDQTKRTDKTFYTSVLSELGIGIPSRVRPEKLADMVTSALMEECQERQARLIILFMDEAQRLLPSDYENLVSIDNRLTKHRYYLCVVFINQRDMTGFSNESNSSADHPPHVTGRFFISKHAFVGVRGASEAAAILDRYDTQTEWPPGSGISFTRHFVPEIFDRGFRLANYAESLWSEACNLRATVRLPEHWTWPMKSFEGTVIHLLTNIIPRAHDFEGLSIPQLQEAVRISGLIELEQSRHTYMPAGTKQ